MLAFQCCVPTRTHFADRFFTKVMTFTKGHWVHHSTLLAIAVSVIAASAIAASAIAASVIAASVIAASVIAASVIAASVIAASVIAVCVIAVCIYAILKIVLTFCFLTVKLVQFLIYI